MHALRDRRRPARTTGATGDLDVTAPLELVADRPRAGDDRRAAVRPGARPVRAGEARGPADHRRAGARGPGGAAGAGVRVVDGRFELRDAAIVGNAGPRARSSSLGDDGMTARDSEISDNVGAGIVDRGGGGLRVAHTEVSRQRRARASSARARQPRGLPRRARATRCAGSRSSATATSPSSTRSSRANGKQAIDEQGDGSVYVRRSRLRDNGADALTEDGDGELSVYRTRVTGSPRRRRGRARPGRDRVSSSARIAFNDGLGLPESDDGLGRARGVDAARQPRSAAIVERGDGGVGLTLARGARQRRRRRRRARRRRRRPGARRDRRRRSGGG